MEEGRSLSQMAVVASAIMEGAVRAGGTRQVCAAVAAAVLRVACGDGPGGRSCSHRDRTDELVSDRLDLIRPVLRAQCELGVASGRDVHGGSSLVDGVTSLRGNVAKHAGFHMDKPISSLNTAQLRAPQRGSRRVAAPSAASGSGTYASTVAIPETFDIGSEGDDNKDEAEGTTDDKTDEKDGKAFDTIDNFNTKIQTDSTDPSADTNAGVTKDDVTNLIAKMNALWQKPNETAQCSFQPPSLNDGLQKMEDPSSPTSNGMDNVKAKTQLKKKRRSMRLLGKPG